MHLNQAWHIFKKDVRHLRIEIVAIAVLAVAQIWVVPSNLPAFELLYYRFVRSVLGLSSLVYPLAMSFLIARVIHSEAIPGTRQFWLTRPYEWKSLLLAKTLFVLVFAHLPLAAMQIAVVLREGFPLAPNLTGLLWSQLLTFACVSLPAGVLAALTPGMVPFIAASLILLVVSSVRIGTLGGVEWVRDTLSSALLTMLAIPVFVWQYRNRATNWSLAWTCAIAIAGFAFYWWMPWRLAFAIQSWGSGGAPAPMLHVAIDPANMRVFPLRNSTTQLEVDVPLSVANAPDLSSFRADALSVTFERSDGAKWTAPPQFLAQLNPYPQDSVLLYYATSHVDRTFLRGGGPEFTVHGELYFTVFERRGTSDHQAGEVANLTSDLQCEMAQGWRTRCRTAFRPGPYLLETELTNPEIPPSQYISYSPFPARFAIQPLWNIEPMSFHGGPPAPITHVTIKEPGPHLRQDFEIRGVRLADFTRE